MYHSVSPSGVFKYTVSPELCPIAPAERRVTAQKSLIKIKFIRADNTVVVGDSLFVLEADPAAKKDAICIRGLRVDDLKLIQSLLKKPDATINFRSRFFP